MKVKQLFIFILALPFTACYNPYKGFDGIDDKGMGRTPPSMEMSKDYKRKEKRMQRRNKRIMKKRKQELGTPVDKSKKRDYTPF